MICQAARGLRMRDDDRINVINVGMLSDRV